MTERNSISWMPSWVDTSGFRSFDIGDSLSCLQPTSDDWPVLARGLRRASSQLKELSIREIIAAIDRVAARWCDRSWETRQRARDLAARATGFSLEAIERSFDVELRNYRADSLWRTLHRELGDPRVLDGFRANEHLDGFGHAIGPDITATIFTGNVPGLPALSIVRALLVKSAVVAKVASGEPSFAAQFARSLYEEEPRLGDAVVVTYWARSDQASLQGVLGIAEALIAYGGEDACAAIRAVLPDGIRYIEHGHKFSAGLITRDYLLQHGIDKVADQIAIDVSIFNQHACIAPQAYLVVGDPELTRELGRSLARALDAYADACPVGDLALADAASLQLRRADAAWQAATDEACDLWTSARLDWSIALASEISGEGGGNRYLRLVSVPTLDAGIDALRPFGRYLQNVGLGVPREDHERAALELARIGACRISAPGRMAEPSMMWKHDGHSCVADLVRWCDIEMHALSSPSPSDT